MSTPAKSLSISALALLAHLTLTASSRAQCGATVSIPAFNATWTIQNSPYCVTQTIQVGNLTIDPGVEVRIAPGASLQVVSWLRASGTRERPVVFRAQDLAQGRWGGISFTGPVATGLTSRLENCVITEAADAGVRIVDNDQVSLLGCMIRGNTSSTNGGGVRVQLSSGNVVIRDCRIADNTAAWNGGGVHFTGASGAELTLDGCVVENNHANPANASAGYSGGGIYADGDLTVRASKIAANLVTNYGTVARAGGVRLVSGSARFENTIIVSNRCTTSFNPFFGGSNSEGGGIFANATVVALDLHNSIVCCNESLLNPAGPGTNLGSGILSAASTTTLVNCTIARNAHEGIRIAGGNASITNSIVFSHPSTGIHGAATVTYSDVEGGHAGTGNISFNPIFAGAGCEPEHFALQVFSPCIDAGDPNPLFDDGCRPPAQGTSRSDIGALGGPGNCSFAGPSTITCGVHSYGTLSQSHESLSLDWTPVGSLPPYPGTLSVTNGTPQAAGLLLLAFEAAETPISGVTILVSPSGANPQSLTLDAQGAWFGSLSLQWPFLVGVPVFLQAIELPQTQPPRGSNGLRIATCL